VLRGPQGTLFCKNASAGVVHIITNAPTDYFEADIITGFDDSQEYRYGATISGGLTDSLAGRFTAQGLNRDGYIKNINEDYSGEDLNYEDSWSARAKLAWAVNDEIELTWVSDISKSRGDCCVGTVRSDNTVPQWGFTGGLIPAYVSDLLGITPSKNNLQINDEYEYYSNFESSGHALTIDWNIGDYTLTSITAQRDWGVEEAQGDGTPPLDLALAGLSDGMPYLALNRGISEQEQFSQELRITSPADQFISYVAGLYYWKQNISRQFERREINPGIFFSVPPVYNHGQFDADIENISTSLFGQATINVSDSFRVIAGARFVDEELSYQFNRDDLSLPANGLAASGRDKATDSDLASKLGVEMDVASDGLAYLTLSQGYKGKAFNVLYDMVPETTYEVAPETSNAVELGFKNQWLDNTLSTNIAIFKTEYDDYQSQAGIVPEGSTIAESHLVNAGQVSNQGVELDFTWLVAEPLLLSGGFAYTDAVLDEFRNAPCGTAQGCQFQDVSGGRMPNAPEWKFNIGAMYDISVDSFPFMMSIGANYSWQDEVLFSIDQDKNKIQDAYGIVDISLSLQDNDEAWSAKFYVNNVADENYASYIGDTLGYPSSYSQVISRNAQRIIGGEIKIHFE
jgi:iron complex outermembrane recepter protein